MLGYNKICNIEDFSDPDLRDLIRDIYSHELALFPPNYPDGVADSKQWEAAMAVRTLRDHGCLTAQSRILGAGAGTGITSFYLTRHAREVVAADIYANAHVWAESAPVRFLSDPAQFSPIGFDSSRLLPVHMDARMLQFPAESFEGVYSSGSIEHFGSFAAVANAAYEMGRVLRVGGVAAISTTFKVAGPPEAVGWDPDFILFSPATLNQFIVDASGLTLVDPLDLALSDETVSVPRDLSQLLDGRRVAVSSVNKIALYPNLILYHEGYLFCSVQLALKKTDAYPVTANAWAAPDTQTLDQIDSLRAAPAVAPGASLLAQVKPGA